MAAKARAAANAALAQGKNELADLVLGLTCPQDASNIAMRDSYSARPQARAGPFIKFDLPWNSFAVPPPAVSIPNNQMYIVLRRDPLHAWIHYDPNVLLAAYQGIMVFGNTAGGLTQTQTLPNGIIDRLQIEMTGFLSNGAFNPHDDFLYASYNDEMKRQIWVEGSVTRATALSFTFQGVAASTVTGFIDMWNDNDGDEVFGQRLILAAVIIGTPVVMNIQDRDYRRFELTITAVTGSLTGFQSQVTTTSDVNGHHALPQMTQNRNNITGLKFISNALKWTNNSPVIDLQGRTAYCQFGKADSWRAATFNAPSGDPYQYVASQATAKDISYKKGSYTYIKPEEESDFANLTPFDQGAGFFTDAASGIRTAGFVVVVARAGQLVEASPTVAGRIATAELYFKVSYSTKNIWLDSRAPAETPKQWTDAVEVVSTMEQFFEDPNIQWKTVLASIGSLARLSAPIVSALGPYGRIAGTVLTGVGAGLGALGYRTKKTARPPKEQDGDRDEEDRREKAQKVAPGEQMHD